MLTRICLVGALVTGSLLAVLGLLVLPMTALMTWAFLAVLTGPLVAMGVHSVRPAGGHALRAGAGASVAMLAIVLVVAGLTVLLGPMTLFVIPLLVAAGVWWYRRRRAAARLRGGPLTATKLAPTPPPVPQIDAATVPTHVLCAVWQRTYWLLRDLPAVSPDRQVVINIRGRLLEEFERRDPDGFGRWLHTDPRACSDPGRYLQVNR